MLIKCLHQLLIVLTAMLLSSCGGGESDPNGAQESTGVEQINGIVVPSTPGDEANRSIVGIDKNNNGIRDEVERSLVTTYGSNREELDMVLSAAVAAQTWLTKSDITQKLAQDLVNQEIRIAKCITAHTTRNRATAISEYIDIATYNTSLRRSQRNKILHTAGVFEIQQPGDEKCI